MGAFVPHGELANPVGVVEDFESNIREELDFRLEAAHMAEFNRIMDVQRQSRVAAPRVVTELSTERILVMERFYGHRVDDVEKLREAGDAEERLLIGMRAWFQCMILHGFFHGDVHAGNLMALDDGRVGFLDFGIVGRFSPERREQVTDYLIAFATGDFRKLAEVMIAMGSIERDKVDLDSLSKDLEAVYEPMLSNEMCIRDSLNTVSMVATVPNASVPAKLALSVGGYSGDYWILEVGPTYEYAVIGHPSRSYFWILSRSPTLDPATMQGVLGRAESNHFDTSQLEFTPQPPAGERVSSDAPVGPIPPAMTTGCETSPANGGGAGVWWLGLVIVAGVRRGRRRTS